MRAIVLLLAVAACTDAITVDRGVCGNHVLEAGEECDRPGELCTADCRIVCAPELPITCEVVDGVAQPANGCCPPGFACGADRACRAPSGTFGPATGEVPFVTALVGEVRIGDLDGDLIDDAIGVTSGNLIVRKGSPTSPLGTSEQRTIPFANGTIAIDDLTGDGRLDVLIPSNGGVSVFDSASGTPEPVPMPVVVIPSVIASRVAKVGTDALLVLVGTPQNVVLELHKIPASGSPLMVPRRLCGNTELGLDAIGGRGLHPSIDPAGRILAPFTISTPAGLELCIEVLNADGTPNQSIQATITDGVNSYAATPGGEVLFANIDGTACPELVIPLTQTPPGGVPIDFNLILAGVQLSGGRCSVDTSVQSAGALFGGPALGAVRLANGDLGVITPFGVFNGTTNELVFPATRTWTRIAVGNVNGPTLEDFAAVTGLGDVEVFEQRLDGWRVHRIPTAGNLEDVGLGDFDGDGRDDVVFTAVDLFSRRGEVQVAYRTDTVFAAPVSFTRVADYQQLAVVPISDPAISTPLLDVFDDLVISHGGRFDPASFDLIDDQDVARFTALFGGANRQLTAPWLPPTNLPIDERITTATAVAVGPFGEAGGLGMLATFVGEELQPTCAEQNERKLVYAEIPQDGRVDELQRWTRQDPAVCQDPGAPAIQPLDASFYVQITSESDAVLMLTRIGALPAGHCAAVLRSGEAPTSVPCEQLLDLEDPELAAIVPALETVVRVERLRDHELLVVSFLPEDGGRLTIHLLTLTTDPAVRIVAARNLSAEVEDAVGDVSCQEATIAELGSRDVEGTVFGEGPDIAIACSDSLGGVGVYARFAGVDGTSVVEPAGTLPFLLYADLEAGDVNGDGLVDLVATSFSGTVAALLQCDSRGECP